MSITREDDRLIVAGEVDMSNAYDMYLAAVDEDLPSPVNLDLAAVSFLDSVGLSMLLRARDELHTAGKELVLLNPSRTVQQLLDLTALTPHFAIHADPRDA